MATHSERPLSPVLWLLAGCGVTLAVLLVLRATQRDAPLATSATASAAATAAPAPRPSAGSLGQAGAEFAELYLAYLLRTYYVEARGFCPKLLEATCTALVNSDLLANEKSCESLPNVELVLAIGRYQQKVGLPVDGKAGPETVRMILGGAFGSRREMANLYCPGDPPARSSAASAAATGAPAPATARGNEP